MLKYLSNYFEDMKLEKNCMSFGEGKIV
jgi:hypothetical protein